MTAADRIVGKVAELWRYPVKSMRGTRLPRLQLSQQGSVGDRVLALRDLTNGRIASCKRLPRLLQFRATLSDCDGRIRIEGPGRFAMWADDPAASGHISSIIGRQVQLESRPEPDGKADIDRRTVFGDVPVSQMKPEWTPESMPDFFALRPDSFFEIGAVSVLASGSLERLGRLSGGAAAVDRRRFRSNVLIDTGPGSERFVEEEWVGGSLRIGAQVVLDQFEPILWCVTATLAQEDLPRDLGVLRTTARQHGGCLGTYAAVRQPGEIRVGDPVVFER